MDDAYIALQSLYYADRVRALRAGCFVRHEDESKRCAQSQNLPILHVNAILFARRGITRANLRRLPLIEGRQDDVVGRGDHLQAYVQGSRTLNLVRP
jgi:hypothetical protein